MCQLLKKARSYTSRPTVNRDENEVKNSAKMCHACEVRDVVNLWREVVRVVVTACDKMGMGVAMGAG